MDTGLALRSVSKHFGGLQALDGVDFTAAGGEVHALLGQNGSGKSTLVKIVTGFHAPDPGATMSLWGRQVDLPMQAAHEHGIAVIHQDLGLVAEMTVMENFAVTSGFGARLFGRIDLRAERHRCREILGRLGLDVDPDVDVAELSPAARATLAIGRAQRILEEHAEQFVFVLDEPTAYLSADESQQVIELMRSVADAGNAVVFISHRLQEVERVADRITVLRDGRVADAFSGGEGDQKRIVAAMLGRRLEQFYPDPPPRPDGPVVLAVKGLAGRRLHPLSFTARQGEIIGFAGLVGMGHEELPHLLTNSIRSSAGRVVLDGRELTEMTVAEVIDGGVSLVPGNRQRDGAWPQARARENLALLGNRRGHPLKPLNVDSERRSARAAMTRFGVRPAEPDYRVDQFSGGNQQKIVLAKWMTDEPKVLVLDEPTQGIDAGAKFDVLKMVGEAAAEGTVVLVASGDYEQLAHLCHRVFVLRFGRVVAELSGEMLSEESIAHHAQNDADSDLEEEYR